MNERHNLEYTKAGVRVCRGEHDKALGCQWEEYVSQPIYDNLLAERDRYREALEKARDGLYACADKFSYVYPRYFPVAEEMARKADKALAPLASNPQEVK